MHGVRSPRVQRAGALPAVGTLVNQPAYSALVAGFGRGRVVYFPWDIDRVYWEVMVDDHGRRFGTPSMGLLTKNARSQYPVQACST